MLTGRNSGLKKDDKIVHMKQLAEYRRKLYSNPILNTLFIEMTSVCNEHCRHCGSRCESFSLGEQLSAQEIKEFLDTIKADFDISRLQLCITGGEPLLRKDFFEIMEYANELGFAWGMTTNATLIDKTVASRLKKAGMRTVSVSVDGLERTHDWFRCCEGSYQRTMDGIRNLVDASFDHVQITTVVHRRNINELKRMYDEFCNIGIKSWRVINVEPIGRAKDDEIILLRDAELKKMFEFIKKYRYKNQMEVCYGCSHYLGLDYEREVRDWYFLCSAGIYTASVCSNGDIRACLDIERRDELIEGNIRRDRFSKVWENGYKIYRSDFKRVGPCKDCESYEFCVGDAYHSWNYDKMHPQLCMKGILFD